MSEKILGEALRHIADQLTVPQRRVLVTSCVSNPVPGERMVLHRAGEHTVRALKQGSSPLVDQDGMDRFLTPLGVAVAQWLIHSGEWEVPSLFAVS